MNERHVVVGAGPVGLATAELLVEQGKEVVLVSRSGAGPEIAGVRREAADVADAGRLTELAEGATALYNCVNPPSYTVWPEFWPPVAAAFLEAAEWTGAVLVTAAALYPYGPVDGPMVEGLPDAATHQEGADPRRDVGRGEGAARRRAGSRPSRSAARTTSGPRVSTSTGHIARVAPAALEGKTVRVFGSPDQPHSFTDVRDMARALVRVAGEPSAWGRVWHAPTNPAKTQTEVLQDVAAVRRPHHRPGEVDAARAAVGRGRRGAAAAGAAGDRVPVHRAVRPRLLGHRGAPSGWPRRPGPRSAGPRPRTPSRRPEPRSPCLRPLRRPGSRRTP